MTLTIGTQHMHHPHPPKHCGRLILFVGLVVLVALRIAPETCLGAAPETASETGSQKVLFLGNSITLHGPAPAIGWVGKWGMAASEADKDFVHIVTRSLAKKAEAAPEVMVRNIATFERQYETCDVKVKWKEAFDFQADLVILAIGENVPALKSEEAKMQFEKSVTKLLRDLTANSHPTIVVRSSFWPNQAKDEALKRACQDVNGTFVDIGSLSKNESNYARSERDFSHKGVAAHPGDRGMQAIADAILDGIRNQQGNRDHSGN